MRLLLRFTYNFGPIGPGAMDAPIDVIATHIDQIAPIVRRHRDLIFALEAGFIGTWGEWHDSTNGNDNAAAHKVVLDKELAHFRGLFPILVRDPGSLVEYTGSLVPEPGLGIHDDYYASNVNDAATWVTCAPRSGFCLEGYTPDQMRSYGAQIATTTMFAGEFGAVYVPLENCSSLSAYSYTYHPQSISLHPYPPDVATFLAGEGCAPDFYNRVGTRIVLQNVNVIGDAVPGGRLYVTAQTVNDGYGRVIRRRPATLVFLQDGIIVGRHEISTAELDLRTLQSAAIPTPVTFGFEATLPTQLHPGSVLLALLFSDPAPSLHSQPAYALPLNSLGPKGNSIFDVATGVNGIARFDIY
jgi:hypothetical protein